ncbi:MAG: glycosyltransferase family 4 protein [Lachnospiraceae bacterium]
MKVLIIANNDAGLYRFRKELIQELIQPGKYIEGRNAESCNVFALLPEGDFIEALKKIGCNIINGPIDRRGMNPLKEIKLIDFYRRVLKKVRPDVVLTYTIKPNIYGGFMCSLKNIDYISNITGLGTSIENGGVVSKLVLYMYKIGLSSAKTVFFQNKANKAFFESNKITGKPGILIPGSGVNLCEHYYEEYPEDDGVIRFLYVGRIMKDKGIEELLGCAEKIKRKYSNIEFDLIGRYDDEMYKIRIEELDRSGVIHYCGRQLDVHSFYKSHHAIILPSYHEGLSNVLLESSATGRPVLATTVPGCSAAYDEGISGMGFEAKNTDALIEAVEKFIALPYEKKRQMGLAARYKMEREFDKKIVIKSYLKAINS